MKRFYISRIAASGNRVKYSAIDFDKGVNIIHGPSNTGKSYVLNCINFMFGSKNEVIPFTKSETGYDTITMRMENEDGDFAEFERKIKDGKNGETGSGKVKVTTSLEGCADGEYSVSDKEYSDFLLHLFGITERHPIIANQNFDSSDLTIRMIFHFFFLDEEHIFKKDTAFYSSSFKKTTAHIMSLLFLMEGNDYGEIIPKESAAEREKKAVQKSGNIHRLVKCPFCDHEMREQPPKHTSYIEASDAELERVTVLLDDLQEAEKDVDEEIASLESQINALNSRNDDVTKLIGKQLKPRATELRGMVSSYKRVLQMQQEIYAIDAMSAELNTDAFDRESDSEESELKFNAKDKVSTDIWKVLSDRFAEAVVQCSYPGRPEARIDINTMDAVVNGKYKKDEGKGYRAFLNTIMLFNLMKYLEKSGAYASRLLFLDSPILSLKEKKHKIAEDEKATPGMRESLFRYIIENCGENQVIIAENELPEYVDYSGARLIEFTMDEETTERYGFLASVRNKESE